MDVEVDDETLEGEWVTVAVAVEYTGNETVTDTLTVELGDRSEEPNGTVPASETNTTTVGFETDDADAGEYTVSVTSSSDGVEASTGVVAAESTFEITGLDTSPQVAHACSPLRGR